jgi:hypothetical protein
MKPGIITLLFAVFSSYISFSQDSTVTLPSTTDTMPQQVDSLPITNPNDLINESEQERSQEKKKLTLAQLGIANRSKDHFLIQVGIDNWANKPDTINTKGFSRSFNMYLMFDFPFKTNPHISVGVGAGIGTSNMYFKDTYIDIAGKNANRLSFQDVSDTTHFKKYKLMTTYLEAPVELRYTLDPAHPKKSFKAALGAKIGTMIGATTKGKNFQNSAGNTINSYTQKEKTKRYFNSTRLAVTGRVGFGVLSLFATYQVNAFIKEGFGPDVRPYSIGLTLSGL